MAEKSLKVQFRQRRAKASYWEAHKTEVTPGAGEIIVYLPDETQTDISFKIGDGSKNLSELPMFVKVSGGPKGEDCVGISDIKIENSNLMLKYTNSETYIDLGKVVGDKGDTGATGDGIKSITKTSTSGLVDTYTITFTSGSTTTFTVTNGSNESTKWNEF